MSEYSLFTADGLLAGFFLTSLGRSALTSGATAAWDSDWAGSSFDEGLSKGLAALFCTLLPWLSLPAFLSVTPTRTGDAPMSTRLPDLRYKAHR